ncbi:hypothetical protein [Pseudoxanthomonas yeongjuensis]|uniref:hypothetical protein n=1 Tax=Pseudoxanthomonas yeongjuensis TaxID=377616 RepID=UPI001391E826|nr:hypothetical protein [Pseudoxanthomonas yeongjuensis]
MKTKKAGGLFCWPESRGSTFIQLRKGVLTLLVKQPTKNDKGAGGHPNEGAANLDRGDLRHDELDLFAALHIALIVAAF